MVIGRGLGTTPHAGLRIVNEKTREAMEDPVHTVLKTQRVVGEANDTALLSRDGSERHIAHSSGYADDPAIVEHERWGFAGAIRKPFRLEEFAEELGRVLAR